MDETSSREIGRLTSSEGATRGSAAAVDEGMRAEGRYVAELRGPDGELKWRDEFDNAVLTAGKNDLLDKYLAGSSYTAAFYVGLISSVGYSAIAAADTMASHAGWTEAGGANAPAYSQSTRATAAWATASGGSKALSAAAQFTFTSAGTVKGCFLTTSATKDGTTGVAVSAGLFAAGDKTMASGDTLSVSYSLSV